MLIGSLDLKDWMRVYILLHKCLSILEGWQGMTEILNHSIEPGLINIKPAGVSLPFSHIYFSKILTLK